MPHHLRIMRLAPRATSLFLSVLFVGALVACGPTTPEPPSFGDPATFSSDPAVAELITGRLAAAQAAPRAVEVWRGLGLAFEANGFPREAVKAYGHAAALDPGDGRTQYHLAVCLESFGDLEGAVEHFSTAARLGARHAPIYWRQGFAELALGRLDAAEASFRRALELNNVSQPARVGLARVALARQDSQAAMAHLEPLLVEGQGPPVVHHLMATALRLAGRLDEMEPHLQRSGDGMDADEMASAWPDVWQQAVDALRRGFPQRMRLGEQALAEGRLEDAAGIFRQLSEERPDDPLATANLAATLIASGRSDEAIPLLEPLDEEGSSQRFNVVMNLAAAHFTRGDLARAKSYAERARDLDPGKPRPIEMLGAILLSEGRGEEALELLHQAVRLDPSNAYTGFRLARACEQLGRWPEAVEQYRRLVEASGGRADFRLRLARSLIESGSHDEASTLLDALDREELPASVQPELEALRTRLRG